MVRLYIDLETYRPRREDAFIDERIICAGILLDRTRYEETSLDEKIEPIIFSEWDGLTEERVVFNLNELVKESLNQFRFTIVCGFNILRFDIPLLICRSLKYTHSDCNSLSKMWYDCYAIDLMQQLLMANWNLFRGTSLGNIVNVSNQLGLDPPEYLSPGTTIKELVDDCRFAEIEKHLVQDLDIIRWLDLYGARSLIEISVNENRPLFRD